MKEAFDITLTSGVRLREVWLNSFIFQSFLKHFLLVDVRCFSTEAFNEDVWAASGMCRNSHRASRISTNKL